MSLFDKLPKIPFLSSKNKHSEVYFALNISQNSVTGSVWGMEGNRMWVISTAHAPYKEDGDSKEHSEEALIEAANISLDEALADFTPEPSKILFGVPDDWLQDEDLKPEYLKLLRRMVKELDVVPMAFVSTTHAICHLLQKQTGAPTTAVLVNVDDPVSVAVVKGGKILASKSQKRSGNLPEDIEKALLSFSDIEVLPSKIIVIEAKEGGKKLEHSQNKYKEELTSFSWMSQLPFLHLPKIEEMAAEAAIKAVSFAGASEINPEVSFVQDTKEHMPSHSKIGRSIQEEPRPSHQNLSSSKRQLEDLGFVEGDIQEVIDRKQKDEMIENEDLPEDDQGEDVFGDKRPVRYHQNFQAPEEYENKSRSWFGKISTILLMPFALLGNKTHSGGRPGLFGIGVKVLILLLIFAGLIGVAAVFFHKAKVTVFVDLKTEEKDATVVADPSITSVNESDKKIPGKIVDTEVSGSQKGQATGKKKVGDPAKGVVVLYNKTAAPKTFSSGTVLVGPDNLTFALDTSVTVASQSAVEGGISFGKSTGNATAQAIGPDGNLPAGKDLTIKGQSGSDFSAKVDQAFSGGVSKEVTVVTSDDQKKLLAELSSDLRQKAKDEIQAKLTGDLKILAEALSESIVKQSFSKNPGDQATEFSLNLTSKLKGTAYSEGDLKSIVSKLVETNIPSGYELDLTHTETQSDVSKLDPDGKLYFSAKFKAKLMPKLDPESLKKELAGKSADSAATALKSRDNVIGSSIEIKPNLPKPFQRLPFFAKNITIEITAK